MPATEMDAFGRARAREAVADYVKPGCSVCDARVALLPCSKGRPDGARTTPVAACPGCASVGRPQTCRFPAFLAPTRRSAGSQAREVARRAKHRLTWLVRQFISMYSKMAVWIDYFYNGYQWLSLDVAGRSNRRRACWERAGRRLSAAGCEEAVHQTSTSAGHCRR